MDSIGGVKHVVRRCERSTRHIRLETGLDVSRVQSVRVCDGVEGVSRSYPCCILLAQRERVYGITRRERDELVNRQGGTCAICKRRAPVYIDHCHKTNRVRSILCQQCNTAIGLFYEDVEIMQRAMEYVAAIARNE
jgi:hypothetical protein